MNGEVALPPPRTLRPMLRRITERLAAELANPAPAEPAWSALEWRLARAVAALHGASPLLAGRLLWQGPAEWRNFLETQREHVAARHRRIRELLRQIDARAREQGIAFVALKGAELHSMGVYEPGERPMADVDLLVRPADNERAARTLESLGFHESFANIRHRVYVTDTVEVHAGMGEHARNPLKIELHERIAELLPLRAIDVTNAVFPARPVPGLNRYPSLSALITHLAIHAANSMAVRTLRLMHLHDLAMVSSRMRPADWDVLLHPNGRSGIWWAFPPLQLTARYYPGAVPKDVLRRLSRQCHRTLRWVTSRQSLSDVSFSYPWIEAFPGIEWSRSFGATVEYVAARIGPGKEMLRLRRVMAETQVAAAMTEWSRLSQGRRMIRWLTSRQTRIDTLHAVRTALQQPQ